MYDMLQTTHMFDESTECFTGLDMYTCMLNNDVLSVIQFAVDYAQ